jgi:membrane-associated protease RseP (regulator of RpoE activity)
MAYLGVDLEQVMDVKPGIKKTYGDLPFLIFNLMNAIQWIFTISIGLGIANLIPAGPIDGGRMLKTTLDYYFEEQKSKKIWAMISWIFLLALAINLFFPLYKFLF